MCGCESPFESFPCGLSVFFRMNLCSFLERYWVKYQRENPFYLLQHPMIIIVAEPSYCQLLTLEPVVEIPAILPPNRKPFPISPQTYMPDPLTYHQTLMISPHPQPFSQNPIYSPLKPTLLEFQGPLWESLLVKKGTLNLDPHGAACAQIISIPPSSFIQYYPQHPAHTQ
jgi:hypothetical protein